MLDVVMLSVVVLNVVMLSVVAPRKVAQFFKHFQLKLNSCFNFLSPLLLPLILLIHAWSEYCLYTEKKTPKNLLPKRRYLLKQGILKGGSITVLLTSCLTGLESAVWQLTIFVFIC